MKLHLKPANVILKIFRGHDHGHGGGGGMQILSVFNERSLQALSLSLIAMFKSFATRKIQPRRFLKIYKVLSSVKSLLSRILYKFNKEEWGLRRNLQKSKYWKNWSLCLIKWGTLWYYWTNQIYWRLNLLINWVDLSIINY